MPGTGCEGVREYVSDILGASGGAEIMVPALVDSLNSALIEVLS
jgi:hypothetical protein